MVEKAKVPTKEQLRARCEGLSKEERLSTAQFANFVVYFCLLVGEKPDSRQYENREWLGVGHCLEDPSGRYSTITLKYRQRPQDKRYTSAEVCFAENSLPLKDIFVAYFPVAYHEVQYESAMGFIGLLRKDDLWKEPSFEFAGACRKVWEIYNSPKP